MTISAPNFCACTKARPASAWPECRSENRDSSRCGRSRPPARRTHALRTRRPTDPRTRHRPRSKPAGPRRPRRRRKFDREDRRAPCRCARQTRHHRISQNLSVRTADQRQICRLAGIVLDQRLPPRSPPARIEHLIAVARCAQGKFCSRTMSGWSPTRSGRTAGAGLDQETRRKISARMIRSPSATSAINSDRSLAGESGVFRRR